MSSLFTLFIPLGTRVDLYQIITCLFLFYLPVFSICFLHNIFLVLFFLRRKEIGRKRGENTALLSCEGAYLHLCRRCSAKSHFCLVSEEIQVRSLSVSSVEGSTAAMVRKMKGCHSSQQEGKGRMLHGVGGAQHDLQSDFHHLRNTVISEESSVVQRQDLSSIKHHDVS